MNAAHLTATLYGTPSCRRYRRMKSRLLQAARQSGAALHLEEVTDAEALARFNPLSLPRLYLNGDLLAERNPPATEVILHHLRSDR